MQRLARHATLGAVLGWALAGCSGGSGEPPAGDRSNRAPAAGTRAAPVAAGEADATTDELFHALDRKAMSGFDRGELAVGGGWVYWIERPRAAEESRRGTVRRKPTADPAAAPQTVVEADPIEAIAADGDRLYVAGSSLRARRHDGGELVELAPGAWTEVVPAATHLLVRSREQAALVPKAGGPIEPMWQGKHGRMSIAAAGDHFVVVPVSPWTNTRSARAITVFRPGAQPSVIAELPEARGALAVDGDLLYFTSDASALWRIDRRRPGAPERIGPPDWAIDDLVIRDRVLYGAGRAGLYRLPLAPLAPRPERLAAFDEGAPSRALAIDERHVYYLTRLEIRRVAR
ncbi:MAG: hypothetical protein ACTHU0_13950 [Kofleriaceae bacterium]